MCGLTGFVGGGSGYDLENAAMRMADTIAHRGPDDSGVWVDVSNGIALAHRRLSIVDLSVAGHQPMHSACGRFVVVFNGEIYNHRELRRELAAQAPFCAWRGNSDTETLLAAIAVWGLEAALQRLTGMFAFALWDQCEGSLTLARDRLGEKPLYYAWMQGAFVFGSELKALRAHPAWHARIDPDSLALYMRYGYVPAPRTIYEGVYKLPPATFLQVHGRTGASHGPQVYWSAHEVFRAGIAAPFPASATVAADELECLLEKVIQQQMLADVPLGAFLSGGVDSSLVVALMQAHASRPVKTFTIGFDERNYDEAQYARKVADYLGTEHTSLIVSPQTAMSVIPDLPGIYDEPFADSSQIPTILVARLAKRDVSVCLSGDGGDELFGGYNRHLWWQQLGRQLAWMPRPLRHAVSSALTLLPPAMWDACFRPLAPMLPGLLRHQNPGDKLHKLSMAILADTPDQVYEQFVSFWTVPIARHASAWHATDKRPWANDPGFTDFSRSMMYRDMLQYLPDDILFKLDRAAMSASLETRVPMLNHQVVEFAARLPTEISIHQGQGKRILRKILYKYVPPALIERPKMGFGIPLGDWLRGPLREWAESMLSEERLIREGYLDPAPVREKWHAHLAGRRNWAYHLWNVLMFQAWLDVNPQN